MASVAEKRQLVTRSVSEKYKAIKDLERGMTKMDVQQKYAVNRNTLNSWLKSKEKIVTSIEAGSFKGAANKALSQNVGPAMLMPDDSHSHNIGPFTNIGSFILSFLNLNFDSAQSASLLFCFWIWNFTPNS